MELPLNMLREPVVRKCALPITLKGEAGRQEAGGGRRAILGLHGFAGYPGELSLPASILQKEGFSVFVPRLPGHGTNSEDFNAASNRDWIRKAVDSYEESRSRAMDEMVNWFNT